MKQKKIPYGLTDYKDIKENNYYVVDKTEFIEKLENINERFLLFLRPRRFGKTLWLAILDGYYNKFYKENFETMFADTYIGKNITPEANKYLVMNFNFSIIDIDDLENSFTHHLEIRMTSFISKYKLLIEVNNTNPIVLFEKIFEYLEKNNLPLYIMIDEYDHFANRLLFQSKEKYLSIVSDKTAMFKQFFTTLKVATSGNNSPLKRMFITGVTPMTMYDVTSGFNIGNNISLDKNFNNLLGFTQNEVDDYLKYYEVEVDKKMLKEWYNNYIFSEEITKAIYNTDMIIHFTNEFLKNNKIPNEMIDINVRSDYSKLRHIIYTNNRLNGNFDSLRDLIAGETISLQNLVQDFSALNLEKENNFKSLLFYLGLITIKNREFKLNLRIPNETIKRIDIDFLNDTLEFENIFKMNVNQLEKNLENFALNGDLKFLSYLAEYIKNSSGIRDYIYKEQHIKAMYMAYLSLTPYFLIKSEAELNKGFTDIFIKPFNNKYVKYFALLEFKYVKRTDKVNDFKDKLMKEAVEELNKYKDDILVKEFLNQGVTLKKVILLLHGWELIEVKEID